MTENPSPAILSAQYLKAEYLSPQESLPYPDNIMPRPQPPVEVTPNHRPPSWLRHKAAKILGAACALGIGVGGVAIAHDSNTPVEAQSVPSVALQVYRTDGDGLMLHPDAAVVHSATTDNMPDGTEFDTQCWKRGETVRIKNPQSGKIEQNPIWHYGTNKITGHTGYASDYYINIHWKKTDDLVAQGIPECGTALPAKSSAQQSSSAAANALQPAEVVRPFVNYDRSAAQNWARAHARDVPPKGVDSCTWFASQMLKAGGMREDSTWNLNLLGVKRDGSKRYGTDTAWITPQLAQYLRSRPYTEVDALGHMSQNNNNLPKAKPGDIIAYVWNGDGLSTGLESLDKVQHISVVVGHSKDNPQYPTVAEWGNTNPTPYTERGWTYSVKSNGWLQNERDAQGNYTQRNMFAYLIHFRTEGEG